MSDEPIVLHPEIQGAPERRAVPDRRARVIPDPAAPATSPSPPELAVPEGMRAAALDALRGLFLVLMTLGFTVARDDFPLWMYHRQMPPPGETIVDIAGIGWRDLAYGAFLFTMAAALPLTLTRRIEKGDMEFGIIGAAIRRFAILIVFALLVAYSNPFFLGYTQGARALSLVGFAIMALVFTRPRPDWDAVWARRANRTGWVLAVAYLALSPLALGMRFSFNRVDDIITGLAFAALAGSLIWYFTRTNILARLATLAIAVALYLGARNAGWIQDWWYGSPVEWAFAPDKLSLLTVVIPGTIVGDVILRWMRGSRESADGRAPWSGRRVAALALLATAVTPVVVVGLYQRQVFLTTQLVIGIVAAGVLLSRSPATPVERMLRSLFLWGAVWLIVGLLLDPFENGIRKAPETLSYFFTVTGTTIMLLVALTALIDGLGRRRPVSALIDVGHNPLLTYVLYTVLINSLLELVPATRGLLRDSPATAVVRSIVETALVVVLVRFASRRRVFWRT